MSDYEEGTTAPPFHVKCRTTTAPYFGDEFEFGERAARNTDGKTYYIPSNIKYEEWEKKYVYNKVDSKKEDDKMAEFTIDGEKGDYKAEKINKIMQWRNRHIQFYIIYGKTKWQLRTKVAQCKTWCEMEKV